MARVMIDCPTWQKPVYTGNNFTWWDFDALALEERELRCPRCGQRHAWVQSEAYLVADGGEA
jgi:hypothetical protein